MTTPQVPQPRVGGLFQGNVHDVDPRSPIGKLIQVAPQSRVLNAQDVKDATEIQKDQTCRWCGGMHARACPRVKRLAYDQSGNKVTEVEFWPAGEWPDDHVVWPEDLVDTEDGDGDTERTG